MDNTFRNKSYSPPKCPSCMNNTSTMIQDDNMKAMSILNAIQGCKVEDNKGNQYEVADVKCFNGEVSFIGLKSVDGDIKYATLDCYMEMASIA